MNQIARCDWLPERARWSHLARSGLPAVSRKQNFTKSHIINPLLTKFVRSRWLDIGLVFFCEFMDPDFVSVHKHAKKELGQHPAIFTSHLVNNPYILSSVSWKIAIAHQRAWSPHLFSCYCNELITSFAWEKTYLISIAENLINNEKSRYTVVFSILLFGNHVKTFGSKFN